MALPRWLKTTIAIAGAVVPGVAQVEQIARTLPSLRGQQKQDAVVELVKASLLAAEGVTDKDLLDDPAVADATRRVIDVVVALQAVVKEVQAKRRPPVPAQEAPVPDTPTE